MDLTGLEARVVLSVSAASSDRVCIVLSRRSQPRRGSLKSRRGPQNHVNMGTLGCSYSRGVHIFMTPARDHVIAKVANCLIVANLSGTEAISATVKTRKGMVQMLIHKPSTPLNCKSSLKPQE